MTFAFILLSYLLVSLTSNVRGVESVVSCVAAVTTLEVVFVNLLDDGVLMGLSHLHSRILVVKSLSSYSLEIYGVANVLRLNGLTAAVYTAAGASHNLNERPICLTACNLVHNKLCIIPWRICHRTVKQKFDYDEAKMPPETGGILLFPI